MTRYNPVTALLVVVLALGCTQVSARRDTSAPATPIVTDSGQYSDSLTHLQASWASSDAQSGIAEYQYAIGTSATDPKSGYTVGWTSAGTGIQVTAEFTLARSTYYYFYVKARNGVNIWSSVGVSSGIMVDPWPPQPNAMIVTPSRTVLQCGWVAADGQSSITEYKYAVGTSLTDPGSGYNINWTSAGLANSAVVDFDYWQGAPFSNGASYYFYVKARNSVDLWSNSKASAAVVAPLAWVSTYECLGIYWNAPTGNGCSVEYRIPNGQWKNALDLQYDDRSGEYRGSIVNLSRGTQYEVRLTVRGTKPLVTTTFNATTNSDVFPVKETVTIPTPRTGYYPITQGGSATGGYVVYQPAPNSINPTINGTNDADHPYCVSIDASYVILRGFKLQGGKYYGIQLGDVHDVIIENCDISGWGSEKSTALGSGWGTDYEAAIWSREQNLARVTIQRNRIHDPRYGTNSWEEDWANGHIVYRSGTHPEGPHAVAFADSAGNHVIRYNEVYAHAINSPDGNYYNDCLGYESNFSYRGFPGADSDIYGNYLANCWDDAIESEGGDRNIRIWGNFITYAMDKVGTATNSLGPLYVWRNVSSYSRYSHVPVSLRNGGSGTPAGNPQGWDESSHGPFLKARVDVAGFEEFDGGSTYVFNNTVLQPPAPSGVSYTVGCSNGFSSAGTSPDIYSRNNLMQLSRSSYEVIESPAYGDLDRDFYNGVVPTTGCEASGIRFTGGDPGYSQMPSYNLSNTNGLLTGIFTLGESSPGYDSGYPINNFSDNAVGTIDRGAHEYGTNPMEFGVKAYLP